MDNVQLTSGQLLAAITGGIAMGASIGTALWHAAMYVGRLTLRVDSHDAKLDDHGERIDRHDRLLDRIGVTGEHRNRH